MNTAKTVEEIVINGLISGQINPSWYTREDTEDHADKPAKEPHPGNIMNAKRLEEYKAILERLQTEEDQLISLTAQYHTLHARLLDSCAPLPLDGGSIKMAITDVDLSPLSEEDRAFMTEYCSSDTDGERELDESVRALVERYPFQIDNLRKRLYQASIFDEITHLYCEQLMSNLLATVRKRNEGNMQTKAESSDVLRALTRATC
ncbi:5728_t:CDS:2 [Paraglomus brasilianum]|uniref:5728_t:CDS:1 n=1 Tax=Paraglomus brasilianum TaxID=144538 RepID=A0A9N9ALP9_9GLOM|nr:5728_t:CDS:2 [Paraglomus brasilianum]